MAANKTIGGINVAITASTTKFEKGLKAARSRLTSFVSVVKNAIFSLKGLAVAMAGGFAVHTFVSAVTSAADSLDALGKSADKLGITTEALAGFQLAASEADISTELLEKSLARLSVDTGKRADIALFQLIDKAQKLRTGQERLALATEAFGRRGADMVRILNLGRAGMAEAQQAAIDLGLAIDRKTALGVERAIDSFGRLKTALGGIFRTIAADLAPYIEVLSVKAVDALRRGGAAKSIGSSVADFIIKAVGKIGDAIQQMVGGVLGFVADAKQLFYDFRSTVLGQHLVGSRTQGERIAAANGIFDARAAADRYRNARPFSETFGRWVAGARESAARGAAEATRLTGSGASLGGILGGIGKSLAGNLANNPLVSLIRSEAGKTALSIGMRSRLNNMFAIPAGAKSGAGFRSLAAQDPLSREGFSQRVRSMAQNDSLKVERKQLSVLEKAERHLANIAKNQAPRAPANLAGG